MWRRFLREPQFFVRREVRWSLSGHGGAPPTRLILPSVVIIVAVLVSGLFYFQKMEATIADVV